MNLNEAAEIVNKSDKAWLKQNLPPNELRAYVKLVETMLSELDPTPITEEWLAANGWRRDLDYWLNDGLTMIRNDIESWLLFGANAYPSIVITTIGELRTLLRLCGETQGETK